MFFTIRVHLFYIICVLTLFFAACGTENASQEKQPLPKITVHIDAQNQIYVSGKRHHISRIEPLVKKLQSQHPGGVQFIIAAEEGSSIHIINDLCRYLHPLPLQFASADEMPSPR